MLQSDEPSEIKEGKIDLQASDLIRKLFRNV
jgi:hypothetical protein